MDIQENNKIQLFENKKIRTAWNEETEEWYFSVADVVQALTDSKDVKQYIKKMRNRDAELNLRWGTICTLTELTAADGKRYKTTVADISGILRIIQSIPSPKAEPFKMWLAEVGKDRINETIDPELTINRALDTYLKKGYTREWIHQRLQAIQVRKELTDEWDKRGVQKGIEYAILTDEITKAWSGMKTRDYKKLKGLKKENLRDNMSTLELVLNMLAEATTTEISRKEQPVSFDDNIKIAREGGSIAGDARKAIENRTGTPVITSQDAAELNSIVTDLIEGVAEEENE